MGARGPRGWHSVARAPGRGRRAVRHPPGAGSAIMARAAPTRRSPIRAPGLVQRPEPPARVRPVQRPAPGPTRASGAGPSARPRDWTGTDRTRAPARPVDCPTAGTGRARPPRPTDCPHSRDRTRTPGRSSARRRSAESERIHARGGWRGGGARRFRFTDAPSGSYCLPTKELTGHQRASYRENSGGRGGVDGCPESSERAPARYSGHFAVTSRQGSGMSVPHW